MSIQEKTLESSITTMIEKLEQSTFIPNSNTTSLLNIEMIENN